MVIQGVAYPMYCTPVRTDEQLTEKINQAYQDKYSGSEYLPPMLDERPVSATVKVTSRGK